MNTDQSGGSLVFGATGFIGRWFVGQLLSDGGAVVAAMRSEPRAVALQLEQLIGLADTVLMLSRRQLLAIPGNSATFLPVVTVDGDAVIPVDRPVSHLPGDGARGVPWASVS